LKNGETTRQSLSYSAIGDVATKLALVSGYVVLARFLTPLEFGLMAIIAIFTAFIGVLNNLGFDAAIIQHPETVESRNHTAFWTNVLIGAVTAGGMFLSAGLISEFFSGDELQLIVKVSSVVLLLNAIANVPLSLLKKHRKFRLVAKAELGASMGGLILGIVLAILEFGVWSLVAMVVTTSLLRVVLGFAFSKWRPEFIFLKEEFIHLFKFGVFLTGTRLFGLTTVNIDKFLIGKMSTASLLGAYRLAFQIVELPTQVVGGVFHRVFFSVYSSFGNDRKKIREIHLLATRGVAFFTFPGLLGLSILAERFVAIFLGNQWVDMTPIIAFLAVISLFGNVGVLNDLLFLSQGETRLQFKLGFFLGTNVIIGIVIGIQYGINGLLWGLLLAKMLNFYPAYYFSGRLVGITVWDVIQNLGGIVLVSIMMMFILYGIQISWDAEVDSWLAFFLLTLTGVCSYLGLSYLFMRERCREIYNLLTPKN